MDWTSHMLGKSINRSGQSGTTHDNSSSRRSACDRCRRHKLRCVRLYVRDFANDGTARPRLTPCERCRKARAECLYTVGVGTRQPIPTRQDNFERQASSSSSVSPHSHVSQVFQPPLDDSIARPASLLLLPSATASGHLAQDMSSGLSLFGAHISPPRRDGQGKVSSAQEQHAQLSDGAVGREDFRWSVTSDFSGVDLSNICRDFPDIINSTSVDGRPKSTPEPHTMTSSINDHELGLTAPYGSPLKRWLECGYEMSQDSARGSKDRTHSTNPGLSINLEQTSNSAAARGSSTIEICGTKDACLQRLTKLTSQLIMCFSLTEDRGIVKLEDLLAYSSKGKTGTADADKGSKMAETGKNRVGLLLESSQIFLDTLKRLKSLQSPQPGERTPHSPISSDCSFGHSPRLSSFSGEPKANTAKNLLASCRPVDDADSAVELDDALQRQKTPVPSKEKLVATSSVLSPTPAGYSSMPTTFTIISCYMWLFRGYEAIFRAIHNALLTQKLQGYACIQNSTNQVKATGKWPVILPDISIGGFDLNCHPYLQTEMLIHVSCQMLQRIEAALGFGTSFCEDRDLQQEQAIPRVDTHSNGLLEDLSDAPALLQTFLHGTADAGGDGGGTRSARLHLDRGIVQSILDNLRHGRS